MKVFDTFSITQNAQTLPTNIIIHAFHFATHNKLGG